LHIVPRGCGVLISSCLNTYHVPIKLITANRLVTGDFLETKAVWNEHEKRYIIQEISKIERINFDSSESIRPHKVKKTGIIEFKLGQRVIVSIPQKQDRIEQIASNYKELTNIYKIVLLVEESDDCVQYLQDNGIDEVYLIKVNFSTKKQIMLALTSLFNAKRYAAGGKDVVLCIDNLNKLFRLYNTSVSTSGNHDISILNLGPLTDLKTFFMSGKQIKDGGSLTIIAQTNNPSSETEKYVLDDFCNLANVVCNL